MNLIGVALHCHWKQSQHGTVLKIAPCWQFTGSVYTAIIKAVQVMSVCDLKGGTSGTTSHNIYSSWRRFMVTSSVGKRSTQEGTKTHGMQLQSRDIAHCHTFLGLIRTSSVLCTAQVQHGFGLISFTLAGEKVPSRAGSMPACFNKASWAVLVLC